jgi:hypothetical protein
LPFYSSFLFLNLLMIRTFDVFQSGIFYWNCSIAYSHLVDSLDRGAVHRETSAHIRNVGLHPCFGWSSDYEQSVRMVENSTCLGN